MNISKKLTSRKFWIALAGLIVGILALFAVDANTTTQISGVIMSLGSVIAYIVGEGLVDASAAGVPNITAQSIAPLIGTVVPAPEDGTQQAAATAVNNNTAANPPTDGTVA
jgi:hypothetical protein